MYRTNWLVQKCPFRARLSQIKRHVINSPREVRNSQHRVVDLADLIPRPD